MILEIPGQARGSDAGKVMPVAIRLRRELEESFALMGDGRLRLISPILRIGGQLGNFGEDGVENIKVARRVAQCDLVIGPRDWNGMDEDQIYALLKPMILGALGVLLAEAGCEPIPKLGGC